MLWYSSNYWLKSLLIFILRSQFMPFYHNNRFSTSMLYNLFFIFNFSFWNRTKIWYENRIMQALIMRAIIQTLSFEFGSWIIPIMMGYFHVNLNSAIWIFGQFPLKIEIFSFLKIWNEKFPFYRLEFCSKSALEADFHYWLFKLVLLENK